MYKYYLDAPPPTISGDLHIGHIFSYSQMDVISRWLMSKNLTNYTIGFDNNGLPTTKLANKYNLHRSDEIERMSKRVALGYMDSFNRVGMSFNNESYTTYGKLAQEVALLSYGDLKAKGLTYWKNEDLFYCKECGKHIAKNETSIVAGRLSHMDVKSKRLHNNITHTNQDSLYIDLLNHKDIFIQRANEITWHPPKFKARLLNWIENLDRDWSVSRQRKFGIAIPDTNQVFDTWFTSSLTPQIVYSSEVGEATLDVPIFETRFQAHDIITTWAFYTLVKSQHHNNRIPFKNICISGHVVDRQDTKLGKSKGNFKPLNYYLNKYDPHTLRSWACSSALGNDTKILSEDNEREMSRLKTKLVNVSRYLKNYSSGTGISMELYSEWSDCYLTVAAYLDEYKAAEGLSTLQTFFWDRLCSHYIEEDKKESITVTLLLVFGDMLSLLEIYFPNISNEIYLRQKENRST